MLSEKERRMQRRQRNLRDRNERDQQLDRWSRKVDPRDQELLDELHNYIPNSRDW